MTIHTTFIGVDLAWQSDKNHSGVVVARGSVDGAQLIACSNGLATLEGVVAYIVKYATENTVVAIDAPLIINNQTGQRPCETLIGQRFGAQHASAHTSNLKLYPNAGSVRFEAMLKSEGFSHGPIPSADRFKSGKWIFEVYPHPAQIVLFGLERIIKYKKGTVSQKKYGLDTLRGFILDRFLCSDPHFCKNEMLDELLTADLNGLSGRSLKHYEDLLDGCFCAYLALHYWHWGDAKNEIIGNLTTGYIINPTKPLQKLIAVDR